MSKYLSGRWHIVVALAALSTLAFAQAAQRTTGLLSASSVSLAFGYRVSFR